MDPELSLAEFSSSTHAAWRAAAEASLKGAPFDKVLKKTLSEGVTLEPLYDAETTAPIPESWPGLAPFVRGNQPGASATRIVQEIVAATPAAFAEIARAEVLNGVQAVAVHVAPGEAGGLKVETPSDWLVATGGVTCPVYAWAGASALALAGVVEAAGWSGVGGVLADPLTAYARAGESPTGLADLYDDLAAVAGWNLGQKRGLKTVALEAFHYAEAGGTAVEELAVLLATAAEYFRELAVRGVSPAESAPQFLATLSLTAKIFPQIAKIRAARLVWARMASAFGAGGVPLSIHGRTTLVNKSVLDPHTNMLRVTAEAFAGVVANVESLQVAPYDELTGEPTDFSRRIARNVPVILLEECAFGRVADAAGGSWYVETLTRQLAEKAWAVFQEIEGEGGLAAALRKGSVQDRIARSGAAVRAAAATRREGLIGVNLYPNPEEITFRATEAPAPARWPVAAGKGNVPRSIATVAADLRAGVTVSEATGRWISRGAAEPATKALVPVRAAEGYEALRAAADARRAEGGNLPGVWLANFGPARQHKARADFSAGFFAAGGFAIRQGPGAAAVDEAVSAAVADGAPVVVMCSSDPTYPEIVPAFAAAFKAARPDAVLILAGPPGEHEAAWRASGVDDFIHIKTNCLEFLQKLHDRLALTPKNS